MFEILKNIYEALTYGPGIGCSIAFWPLLIGAALGAKSNQDKKEQEAMDRQLAAKTALWSPWTGMTPQTVQRAGSMTGDVASGAVGGMEFSEGMADRSAYRDWLGNKNKPVIPMQPSASGTIEGYDPRKAYAGSAAGPYAQPRSTYDYIRG